MAVVQLPCHQEHRTIVVSASPCYLQYPQERGSYEILGTVYKSSPAIVKKCTRLSTGVGNGPAHFGLMPVRSLVTDE